MYNPFATTTTNTMFPRLPMRSNIINDAYRSADLGSNTMHTNNVSNANNVDRCERAITELRNKLMAKVNYMSNSEITAILDEIQFINRTLDSFGFLPHTSQTNIPSATAYQTINLVNNNTGATTYELVSSFSTTSPNDLPSSIMSLIDNVMSISSNNNVPDNLHLQDVEIGLPEEYKRKMPSKKFKRHPNPDNTETKNDDKTNNFTCSVCLDDFKKGERYRELPCKHIFHKRCVDKWFEAHVKCPMCRQDIRDLIDNPV